VNERTHLDLFSGIGGFALAAKWNGFRTVGFCDNEPYAQAVLKKHWPNVPVHGDIREVRGDLYAGVTLLTGGFPCQPFSVAGKQRGKGDDRYLWPEMLRVIREAKPAWIVGENVAGIVNMALDQVHTDLEAEGYEVESLIVPACAVDAPHRRDRVWIIANVGNPKLNGFVAAKAGRGVGEEPLSRGSCQPESTAQGEKRKSSGTGGASADVADANSGQLGKCEPESQPIQVLSEGGERVGVLADAEFAQRHRRGDGSCWWKREPLEALQDAWKGGGEENGLSVPKSLLGRVAYGIPNRVDKLKGLGNAIVPQVAAEIIRCIAQLEAVK
jgi:DNA (cytosine-5)-methyltransferase 1